MPKGKSNFETITHPITKAICVATDTVITDDAVQNVRPAPELETRAVGAESSLIRSHH